MPASDRSPNPRNASSSTPLRARSTLASLSRRIPLVAPRGSHAPSGAIRALAQARQVLIFAVGETAYAAHALARRISQIDGKFRFVTYENQVRREGVCVISLTDLHPCSLAQHARLALYCCSPARKIDDVTTTDLTPLMAALAQVESCYLQEIGVL